MYVHIEKVHLEDLDVIFDTQNYVESSPTRQCRNFKGHCFGWLPGL